MENNKDIQINNRQAAWLLSGLFAIGFFLFIAGYFLGQRQAVQSFSQKVDQESLADQISSSLFMLYDASAPEEEEDDVELSESEELANEESEEDQSSQTEDGETSERLVQDEPENKLYYYAPLIGYGTKRAADKFCQKLTQQGIPVEVKSYPSRSPRGRKITWYQVVTKPYTDKHALEQLVTQISEREHLKGVRIKNI